jgi:hypothetical protein
VTVGIEVRQEPLLHHFSFPSRLNKPEQIGGRSCTTLFAVPVENVSGSQPGSRKRTGPALIHNQLVDRSLQTNVCHETSCYEFQNMTAASSCSASRNRLALELGVLAGEICDRPPFLKGVVTPNLSASTRASPSLATSRPNSNEFPFVPAFGRKKRVSVALSSSAANGGGARMVEYWAW